MCSTAHARPALTLVTCYPFNFIGRATQAFHRAGRLDLGTAAFVGVAGITKNTPKMLF